MDFSGSKNTHRVFKVDANGRRTFMAAGSAAYCASKAQEFGQRPQNAGHQMIVEPHNGKAPK